MTVFIIRCNDATEFIVDAVAYETLERAEAVRLEIDTDGFNTLCGPHAVYPLRVVKEDD